MRKLRTIYMVLMTAIILLTGCTRPPRPETEITWPAPPQDPRIVYVRSIHGSADLKRSFWGGIKDFFLGRAPGQEIGKPYGVAFDGKTKLYIADTATKGILAFDLSSGTTKSFNSLGRHGTLIEPVYVITDDKQFIYVTDTELKRVVVFTPDYKFSHFIGAEGDFEAPVGMAFDSREENLYVVDTRQHKVRVYSREGEFVREFGRRGDEQGEFFYPLTVAVNSSDTIYIVDSFHFAVQAFDRDGNYLFSFGPTPVGMGSLARPRDIAIDSEGHLYVTDAMRNNIQVFNGAGELLLTFGEAGFSPGEFRLPAGIHIDDDNRLYIADSVNRRVQIFKYLAEE